MPTLHVTPELIARVERFSTRFHAARMGAIASLPGNPFGVELRFLSHGIACKVRHPLLRGKNRIQEFGAEDLPHLPELLRFYGNDGLPFTLIVPHNQMTSALFQRLTQVGLWSPGSVVTPVLLPDSASDDAPVDNASPIFVRRSGPAEKELYLDLFQQAFDDREEKAPEYRLFQWAEDSLPGATRYIAEIDGEPVGMASFPVIDGVGYLGTAGVLPAYRRRGVQAAMIRQRIAEALRLKCDLILAGGSMGTTTYRNFERAGFRLAPAGSAWKIAPLPPQVGGPEAP